MVKRSSLSILSRLRANGNEIFTAISEKSCNAIKKNTYLFASIVHNLIWPVLLTATLLYTSTVKKLEIKLIQTKSSSKIWKKKKNMQQLLWLRMDNLSRFSILFRIWNKISWYGHLRRFYAYAIEEESVDRSIGRSVYRSILVAVRSGVVPWSGRPLSKSGPCNIKCWFYLNASSPFLFVLVQFRSHRCIYRGAFRPDVSMSVPGTPVNNVLNPRARARARTLRRSSHPLPELFCIYRDRTYTENRPNSRFSRSFFDDTRPLLYDRFDRPDVATPVAPPRRETPAATNKQSCRSPRVQITIGRDDIHTLTHKREKHPFELSNIRDIWRGEKRYGVCRASIGGNTLEFRRPVSERATLNARASFVQELVVRKLLDTFVRAYPNIG